MRTDRGHIASHVIVRPPTRPDALDRPSPDRLGPQDPRFAEIQACHAAALAGRRATYRDPDTGLDVMTAATLLERGWCCESGCRHCPYVGTTDKAEWRRWARQVWASLDVAVLSTAVRAALRPAVEQATARGLVLVYRALDGEIDLDALIGDLGAHRFVLTRVEDGGERGLTMHRADSQLERGRFGVLQPVAGSQEIAAGELSLALVPGLVFDREGTRLGHGLGYYDRLLAGLAGQVELAGVAADAVVVAELPRQANDVAMDAVATESGIHRRDTVRRR